ncbi:SUN2 protein, partial [Ceuthmochares aereus]|nr:SUN2 protein [Ceuthmochares aereus]
MSRRSQRLGTTRWGGGEDDAATSSSSLLGSSGGGGGSRLVGREGLMARRKSSSMKRLSPDPSTQTSYYSESMMSESYLGGSRGLAALGSSVLDDDLDSSMYWGVGRGGGGRRRRGTEDTESRKIKGGGESKTYDTYASSSGYSWGGGYAGHLDSGQSSSALGLKTAASRVGSFLGGGLTSPGFVFPLAASRGALLWVKLAAVLQGALCSPHSRRYPWLKRSLLLLLLLLVLIAAAYGAWYFYPYGLSTLSLRGGGWHGAGKLSSSEAGDLGGGDQGRGGGHQLLARFQALEKSLEGGGDKMSKAELWQVAMTGAGGGLEDVLGLLERLMSRRGGGGKKHLSSDMTRLLQGELDALRAQVQRGGGGRLDKMGKASQDLLSFSWHSSAQEGLQRSLQQEVEQEMAVLKGELVGLKSEQELLGKRMEEMLEKLKAMRTDVEAQFPAWLSQFLLQSRWDGAASLILQKEDLQKEGGGVEQKILARVLKDQTLLGGGAQAGTGVAVRQGVTEGGGVHNIVGQALKRYSEGGGGMVDYALESAGASVINTRCSETYEMRTAQLSLFGIPLWYQGGGARVILQVTDGDNLAGVLLLWGGGDVNPGNCWAFRGSQGGGGVRLSSIIHPTAVTLEQGGGALSPQGTISSAPRDFGGGGKREEEGLLLGQFTYEHDGEPIQTLGGGADSMGTYQLVELRVLSNWGHPEYTCIYRFRVHGEPAH